MKLQYLLYPASLASLLVAGTAGAVSMTIGDVDGFGFDNPNTYENAQDGLPDTDGDGTLEPGEFLPDLDNDGNVHYTGNDRFDNRTAAEIGSSDGAYWTDVSLARNWYEYDFGYAPADTYAYFTFDFAVPVAGDSDYGNDHYINFVFGDYDVYPASLLVDGVTVDLTTQAAGEDGLIQLAYANVAWSDMLDGEVVIDLEAPQEPYVAIDYAFLNTEVSTAPQEPGSVPEPSILALLGMGFLGMVFTRRRLHS